MSYVFFVDNLPPRTRVATRIVFVSFCILHLLLSLAAADSLHGQGAPARNEVDDVHRLNAIAVFDKDVVKRKD